MFQVVNVQIFGGFILHIGSFLKESGRFSLGDKVTCKVITFYHINSIIGQYGEQVSGSDI